MPGERLARLPGSLTEADLAAAEVFTLDDLEDAGGDVIDGRAGAGVSRDGDLEGEDGQRRRRRRGGRGRGRGRGRGDGADGMEGADLADGAAASEELEGESAQAAPAAMAPRAPRAPRPVQADPEPDLDDLDDDVVQAPRGPRTTPFGSVWDSQIGTPTAASGTSPAPILDDEDFDEPEIPEYLIAEQRRGAARSGGGGGGGARGGRSAYRSAMERERYGGGGGSRSGGINRYPDVSARSTPAHDQAQRAAGGGFGRRDQAPSAPRSSGEWSEVPPELEEQLRAQLASTPVKASAPTGRVEPVTQADVLDVAPAHAEVPEAKPKRASTRKPAAANAFETGIETDAPEAKPKRASTRKPAAAKAPASAVADPADVADATEAKPKRASTRKPAAAKAVDGDAEAPAAKPKRASTRKPTDSEPA